jgi:peptidoglycan hydrolase-like protein with peptidoglycan-binding domain
MKRVILAAVATAALCVSAIAQQSAQQTRPPQTQNQVNTGTPQNYAATGQLSPDQLSTTQVREIQQALDKKGFKAGRVDGKWGPESEAALKDFQKSQNMPANGQLDQMTMTALGLNMSDFGSTSATTGQAPRGAVNPNTGGANQNPPR